MKLYKAITQVVTTNFKTDLKKRLEPIKKDVKSLLSLKTSLEEQRSEINTIKAENTQLKDLCNKMVQEHSKLKRRVAKLEETKLDANVLFHGLPETQWEKDYQTLAKVYDVMAKTVDGENETDRLEQAKKVTILSARRLGRPMDKRTRPIQVKYKNEDDVIMLLNNKRKLPKGVYADKEYSAETERCRRILGPILKAAKKLPEYKRKSKLEGDTLVIKSQKYTINDLHKLPEKLNSFNATSTLNDNNIAFFGELNPLSNFHPAKFNFDGKDFTCSEQLIQCTKATYFGDSDTAQKILESKTGIECKRLSRDIDNYNHEDWKEVAKIQCERGITEKYLQNGSLMRTLINTGSKTIVESSRDTLWGTGIDLHSDDTLTREKWKNVGILWEILMSIRDTYLQTTTSVDIERMETSTNTTS